MTLEREIERVATRALHESRLSGGGPVGLLEGVEAFLSAINFADPLLVAILSLHALFLTLAVLTRKHMASQIALLIVARQ
jgi:hypothetical protein